MLAHRLPFSHLVIFIKHQPVSAVYSILLRIYSTVYYITKPVLKVETHRATSHWKHIWSHPPLRPNTTQSLQNPIHNNICYFENRTFSNGNFYITWRRLVLGISKYDSPCFRKSKHSIEPPPPSPPLSFGWSWPNNLGQKNYLTFFCI